MPTKTGAHPGPCPIASKPIGPATSIAAALSRFPAHVEQIHSGHLIALGPTRLARAKAGFTTRRVPLRQATTLITGDRAPRAGDLVLARIESLGQHKRIELTDGRRAQLHVGDEIVVAYGNRYAPDQFEAEVPADLRRCHLVAAGGIAAKCIDRHSGVRRATQIEPLGLLADTAGRPLNLADWGLTPARVAGDRPHVTAVVGTAMNAGKTTTAKHLTLGMARQGLKVGAAKVTGTGAGGDLWSMIDAGAHAALDFTDCGVPSTYKMRHEACEVILETIIAELTKLGVDAIVVEVADGIFQDETRELVRSETFARLVDGVIFAAGDALGAYAGVTWLKEHGVPAIAVSGALTASPLAAREAAEATGLPVLDRAILDGGAWLPLEAAPSPVKHSYTKHPHGNRVSFASSAMVGAA